jgi:hypothetical protein
MQFAVLAPGASSLQRGDRGDLEGAIGAVPFAGDANRRNVAVQRQHFARTGIIKRPPGRQSRLPPLRPEPATPRPR